MFIRIIHGSFSRSLRRKALSVAAVALGTAVATAMLAVSLDVGDKMSRELRSFGANIMVTPAADSLAVDIGGVDYRPVAEGAFIPETVLAGLKGIFWRNAIAGFTPFLYVPAEVRGRRVTLVGTWMDREFALGSEKFRTGARDTNPTWHVQGAWPRDEASDEALAGRRLGFNIGDEIDAATPSGAAARLRVTGVLATGGAEEDQLFVPLAVAQTLAGTPGQVRRVQISAMIKPDDDFARRDPASMTRVEYDRWYCTPYIGSIIRQVQEALPGTVGRPIRQVAENEGSILRKVGWLMTLLSAGALSAAGLAVSSATATVVIERRGEVALMKALGASQWTVSSVFLAEAALQGALGGLAGYVAGVWLAEWVAQTVFAASVSTPSLLFPLALAMALAVSLAGAAAPLRGISRIAPATVLKEER